MEVSVQGSNKIQGGCIVFSENVSDGQDIIVDITVEGPTACHTKTGGAVGHFHGVEGLLWWCSDVGVVRFECHHHITRGHPLLKMCKVHKRATQ
ncbi:hypothetical protein AAFF_G00247590 [Aldrovandia affinis]|uniref:Uncharacterized protein n=1 Tax=Aldrovandia affinis TaxID=143900 RepID=A0AAD7WTJ4_9TELE|nr:hypothetical protein AAFF_G00247590 [Aldrovandia affinis]